MYVFFSTPEYKLLFNFPSKAQAWCDFSEDGAEREFQSMNMCILSEEMFRWNQPTIHHPVNFTATSKIVFAMIFTATNVKRDSKIMCTTVSNDQNPK